jgi:hypothetical protein
VEWDEAELATRIRARGLPESVVTIATAGGSALHRTLEYRAESVWSPAWSVLEHSARADLVPLWMCGTTAFLSAEDGTFLEWDAEEDHPWRAFATFTDLVRSLLTDLYEDETDERSRRDIARLLVPRSEVRSALRPEDRSG